MKKYILGTDRITHTIKNRDKLEYYILTPSYKKDDGCFINSPNILKHLLDHKLLNDKCAKYHLDIFINRGRNDIIKHF